MPGRRAASPLENSTAAAAATANSSACLERELRERRKLAELRRFPAQESGLFLRAGVDGLRRADIHDIWPENRRTE